MAIISATGHPIHFMFHSIVGFLGSADRMTLFPVLSNPIKTAASPTFAAALHPPYRWKFTAASHGFPATARLSCYSYEDRSMYRPIFSYRLTTDEGRSFVCAAAAVWNSLSDSIKDTALSLSCYQKSP